MYFTGTFYLLFINRLFIHSTYSNHQLLTFETKERVSRLVSWADSPQVMTPLIRGCSAASGVLGREPGGHKCHGGQERPRRRRRRAAAAPFDRRHRPARPPARNKIISPDRDGVSRGTSTGSRVVRARVRVVENRGRIV